MGVICLPDSPQWQSDPATFTVVDPTLNVNIPGGSDFWVSVALSPVSTSSSQQAALRITTENGIVYGVGVRAGVERYHTRARIVAIVLDTGASGGYIGVWFHRDA